MDVEALSRPLSIDAVRDGGVYSLSLDPLPQTSLFFKVGRVDDVFVKMTSPLGLEDYRTYIKRAQPAPAEIRPLEGAERFDRLDSTLQRFPEFLQLGAANREVVHYLAVHRIQYERLRATAVDSIPVARFALLQSGRLLKTLEPIFIIAFIVDAPTVRAILTHIGEPTEPPRIAPARGPPLWKATGAEHDPPADPLLQPAPAFEFDQRIAW